MARYPVAVDDGQGQVEAINYLLSGPAGLGQNFAGYSNYLSSYLTGSSVAPYNQDTVRNLYVDPITISTASLIDSITVEFGFFTPQLSVPFNVGDRVTVTGNSESFYNQTYEAGVISCTLTSCQVRLTSEVVGIPIGYTGSIGLNVNNMLLYTDCNAKVTVTGQTDKVFVSGQLEFYFNYNVPIGSSDLNVNIQINRFRAHTSGNALNPNYYYTYDGLVTDKFYSFPALSGTASTTVNDAIFTNMIDQYNSNYNDNNKPWPAYYWYVLQVIVNSTGVNVTSAYAGLRSLAAQVVKQ
jgi:hypothetical protein